MFNFFRNPFQKSNDEEYYYAVNEDGSSSNDEFKKNVTDFYRMNRRLTYKLCKPILELDKQFLYCGIGRMPGLWIASALRNRTRDLLVNKKPKKGMALARKPWENPIYSRQEHLVESCTRHLMRRELESLLGECKYAMTCYDDLIRFSIPYDKRYMIFINTDVSILDSLPYVDDIYNFVNNNLRDKLIQQCNDEMLKLENNPQKKEFFIKDFFGGEEYENPVDKTMIQAFTPKIFKILDIFFNDEFKKIKVKFDDEIFDIIFKILTPDFYNQLIHMFDQEFTKFDVTEYDDEFDSKINELINNSLYQKLEEKLHPYASRSSKNFTANSKSHSIYDHPISYDKLRTKLIPEIVEGIKSFINTEEFYFKLKKIILKKDPTNFMRKIRYAAVVSMKSYPLGRYVRKNTPLVLTSYDELEHLVESISRQKMRRKVIQFFGNTKLTFSVYKKFIRMSIPLNDEYVLFFALDQNFNDPAEFSPFPISKIFDFLKKFDSTIIK